MVELLKEIAAPPVWRSSGSPVSAGSGGFAAIQTVAPSFGVELTPVGVRDADEIARHRGLRAFREWRPDFGWAAVVRGSVLLISSSRWRRSTGCRRSTPTASSLRAAA